MFSKKLVLTAVFLFLARIVFAQYTDIIADAGFGRDEFNGIFQNKKYKNASRLHNFRMNLMVSHKPSPIAIHFNGGLTYLASFGNEMQIHQLKIPLGFDFIMGHRFQVLFGAGLSPSFVLYNTAVDTANSMNVGCSFVLGAYTDLKFKYQLNNKWNVFVKFQMDYGLDYLYNSYTAYHTGHSISYYFKEMTMHSYSINTGFGYRIHTRNKT